MNFDLQAGEQLVYYDAMGGAPLCVDCAAVGEKRDYAIQLRDAAMRAYNAGDVELVQRRYTAYGATFTQYIAIGKKWRR